MFLTFKASILNEVKIQEIYISLIYKLKLTKLKQNISYVLVFPLVISKLL